MKRRRRAEFLGGLLALVVWSLTLSSGWLWAAEYPAKPIKLIVPFAAGGPTDVCCRKLADLAAKDLGQEVIVENKTGAGGAVGSRFVAFSKPDGYTIGSLGSSSVVIQPHLAIKMEFDPLTDFSTIAQYAIADHPLAVPANSPMKTFKDFFEEARKRQVTYSSMELIAASIAMTQLAVEAKLNLKMIPFNGGAPAITNALGGHSDAVVSSGMYEYVRGGKLRLLAQTGGERNKEFPDIPTLKDLGYQIEARAFYGIVGPKGLPEPIRKKLEAVFSKAIQDPSFAQVVHNASFSVVYRNGADFGRYIKEVFEMSQKEFKQLGLGKYAKEKK